MFTDDIEAKFLNDYRKHEVQLHLELSDACRKYLSKLGIISIIGILDIVKQETIKFEGATKKLLKKKNLIQIT